jgi:hypothetical protein
MPTSGQLCVACKDERKEELRDRAKKETAPNGIFTLTRVYFYGCAIFSCGFGIFLDSETAAMKTLRHTSGNRKKRHPWVVSIILGVSLGLALGKRGHQPKLDFSTQELRCLLPMLDTPPNFDSSEHSLQELGDYMRMLASPPNQAASLDICPKLVYEMFIHPPEEIDIMLKPGFNWSAGKENNSESLGLFQAFGLAAREACKGVAFADDFLSSTAEGVAAKLQALPKPMRRALTAWWHLCEAIPWQEGTAGYGPAHFACVIHSEIALFQLHERGYDLASHANQVCHGYDAAVLPVHVCSMYGFHQGIHALFVMHYSLDARDVFGETALDKALLSDKVRADKLTLCV